MNTTDLGYATILLSGFCSMSGFGLYIPFSDSVLVSRLYCLCK